MCFFFVADVNEKRTQLDYVQVEGRVLSSSYEYKGARG